MVGYGSHTEVWHMTSPVRRLAPYSSDIQWLADRGELNQLKPPTLLIDIFAEEVCDAKMKKLVWTNFRLLWWYL